MDDNTPQNIHKQNLPYAFNMYVISVPTLSHIELYKKSGKQMSRLTKSIDDLAHVCVPCIPY